MNSLSFYIEKLLLTHDCVVVPQFGAFVTMTCSAKRVEDEEIFYPPMRIVRFNPHLTTDDGLLVSLLRRNTRLTEADAKHRVQSMVLQLRQQLLSDGQVDFGSLGVFTQDEDSNVDFEPCLAGAITPEFYGLDAFAISKLSAEEMRRHKMRRHRFASDEHPTHITISIDRRKLRNAVMSAAAILVCVFMLLPFGKSQHGSANEASVISSFTTETVAPKPVATPSPVVATPQPQEITNDYCVVLASAISQKNAEAFVVKLQEKGYTNACVYNNGNMNRVVLAGYATETDAYNKAHDLHRLGGDFASAWVMQR